MLNVGNPSGSNQTLDASFITNLTSSGLFYTLIADPTFNTTLYNATKVFTIGAGDLGRSLNKNVSVLMWNAATTSINTAANVTGIITVLLGTKSYAAILQLI